MTMQQPQPSNMNEASQDQDGVEQARSPRSRRRKSSGAFRTISEVADELGVQQHVLRFWETKFSQIRPLKRGGGRRYYRPEDLALLKKVHELLYTQGYTIKGVQKLLKEQGKNKVLFENAGMPVPSNKSAQAAAPSDKLSKAQRTKIQSMLDELKELRDMLKSS